MVNIKKLDFFNVITGDSAQKQNYGLDAAVYRKTDNVDMIFDSRGNYLGIRTCRGKIINGKYTSKKGVYDFKSFLDLTKYWSGRNCRGIDVLETKEGTFVVIRNR